MRINPLVAAGGKGQPGGQQPGGQPPAAGGKGQAGGQPPAAGGKGQIGGGGQSPAPGGKGQPGSPGMNPQMAGPIINNPSMGGSQQPQMPITQLMQQFNQAQAMGGQQPGAQPSAAGGKGQPGGQQQGSLPSYAQSYYQQVMGGQPLQASSQGRDTAAIQNQLNDLNRNYAAQRGPQPNNPLARPQQLRPEDPRMMAMRNLQQLQRG